VPLVSVQVQQAKNADTLETVLNAVHAYKLAHYCQKGEGLKIILQWNGTADIDIAHNLYVNVVGKRMSLKEIFRELMRQQFYETIIAFLLQK
jgi:hypothetical protein